MQTITQRRLPDQKSRTERPPPVDGTVIPLHSAFRLSFEKKTLSDEVLNHLGAAIAVVTGTGIFCFANGAMRELAATRECLSVAPNGRLYFVDRLAESSFLDALANPKASTTFAVRSKSGELRLWATLTSLPRDGGPLALVTFTNPLAAAPKAHFEYLMQEFGLTPAERRLAIFLVSGRRLMEAARTFALSPHTVRNQLRAIFVKTGAKRQTDLLRLLHGG